MPKPYVTERTDLNGLLKFKEITYFEEPAEDLDLDSLFLWIKNKHPEVEDFEMVRGTCDGKVRLGWKIVLQYRLTPGSNEEVCKKLKRT